jgi:hypothetical protein
MSWQENINTIKEIYPGQYQIILDFATNAFLKHILDERYKYVWVYNNYLHERQEWKEYDLPLIDNETTNRVLARNIIFDFAMPTLEFKKLLPRLTPGIFLVQLNTLPKYYLDPERLKGKTRYELLSRECDYLFEIDLPSATDYGTLISADKVWLQSVLDNKNINWDDLP